MRKYIPKIFKAVANAILNRNTLDGTSNDFTAGLDTCMCIILFNYSYAIAVLIEFRGPCLRCSSFSKSQPTPSTANFWLNTSKSLLRPCLYAHLILPTLQNTKLFPYLTSFCIT